MSEMLDALIKEKALITKEKGGLCDETKYIDVCMEWIRAGDEIANEEKMIVNKDRNYGN